MGRCPRGRYSYLNHADSPARERAHAPAFCADHIRVAEGGRARGGGASLRGNWRARFAMEPDAKRPRTDKITMRQCQTLLKPLVRMAEALPFLHPVDHERLNLPDYPVIVKQPMDLGTIEGKLSNSTYEGVDDFVADVRLVWANARLYNPPHNDVAVAAAKMSAAFEERLGSLLASAGAAVSKGGTSTPRADPPALPATEQGLALRNAKAIVKSLSSHPSSVVFRQPVDHRRLNLPSYPDIIKRPMDLSTVHNKLSQGDYATVGDVRARPQTPREEDRIPSAPPHARPTCTYATGARARIWCVVAAI